MKFVIIDENASDPNLPVVWTGSTNWTDDQLTTDANNVIIFQDQSLARGYKLEFDEMWGNSSQTAAATPVNSKFGQYKSEQTVRPMNTSCHLWQQRAMLFQPIRPDQYADFEHHWHG